jgi:hypothetical protein
MLCRFLKKLTTFIATVVKSCQLYFIKVVKVLFPSRVSERRQLALLDSALHYAESLSGDSAGKIEIEEKLQNKQ